MGLSARQQAFVSEYIQCLNASEAARKAGYKAKANVAGSQLLANPNIKAEIDRVLREYAMSAGEVLYHLTVIARGDIGDVLDDSGNLDMITARENHATALIRKVKNKAIVTENSDISEGEVETYDRLTALGLLAKYHDLVNKVRVEDWRSQAIADIRAGKIPYEALADAFDHSLAAELFAAAGIPVQIGEGAEE